LVEIPTPDETNDNIVVFWAPARPLPANEAFEFGYRLHWSLQTGRQPPAGFVASTRLSDVQKQPGLTRFLVDFDGPYLRTRQEDFAPEPVVTVGAGAALAPTTLTLQNNPNNGTWRVAFAIKPDGTGRPVELRCFLRKEPHVLTETWSYLWNP
jgi:glucans biosynthesis protein